MQLCSAQELHRWAANAFIDVIWTFVSTIGGGNGLTVEIQAEFSVQQLRFVFQIDTQDTQADWLAGSSDL